MKTHRRGGRLTPFKAGLIGIILIVAFSYGAYTKFHNPFASPYTIHAIFPNANGLRPDSLVRIAGINVGKVDGVAPVSGCKVGSATQSQCAAADVTMSIDDNGLPLHEDATFWIRPRIFLEGNFFVDINPGTPEAPNAPDGYVFPIQQGIEPVQFDQLLTSLQNNTRANLQILLQQYGQAVKVGGPSYNKSIQYWSPAYKYGAEVSHDTLGTQPHDLSNWIDKGGAVNGALSAHPQNLENLVTDFNTTAGAFARENTALSNAVHELPITLQVAMPALNALNAAFPPLRQFAVDLVPGVKSTGPMVDASLPFFHQLRELVQRSELGGLTNDLSVTIPALARLNAETIPFMKNGVRPASSCQVNVILPWTRLTVPDSNFNASNGFPPRPVYVEGVDFLPGLAGESRDFDPNGPYVRILGTGGTITYSLQPGLFGQSLTPIQGVQPQVPAPHNSGDGAPAQVTRPPLQPNVQCETQPPITDLSAPQGAGPQPSGGGGAGSGGLPGLPGGLPALKSQMDNQAIAQIRAMTRHEGLGFHVTPGVPGK
jgi:phospholipid/cholesterol/gamma-HCH transport system substrate-binding protein